jgi:hypothetical protein
LAIDSASALACAIVAPDRNRATNPNPQQRALTVRAKPAGNHRSILGDGNWNCESATPTMV